MPEPTNSTEKQKNENSGRLEVVRKYKQEDIRALVFQIKIKGRISIKEISRRCNWSASRLTQIVNNWNDSKYVSNKLEKQDEIYEKLQNILKGLDFANKINTLGVENGN